MNKFIGFSFLFQRILLMLLAVVFLGMAIGSHPFSFADTGQMSLYASLVVFVLTYFFLRAVRNQNNQHSNVLHWITFCLLFVSCYGLLHMLVDIWEGQEDKMYLLLAILLAGILNGLFLCCVFLSRRRV